MTVSNQCNQCSELSIFQKWASARLQIRNAATVKASVLFDDWYRFATEVGAFPGSRQLFGRRMTETGYASKLARREGQVIRIYSGLEVAQ